MNNCLERLLYETISGEQDSDNVYINTSSASDLVSLVKEHNLNPNYVFTSQYSITKSCFGKPLLYLAILHNRADLVRLLLSRDIGASPNCSRQPFSFEISEDDPFKRTAIFQSLSMSSPDIFNMLLNAKGCDALAVDSFNCSLLWHAVNMAHLDKIFSIINSAFGPKLVNLPDRCGLRPLHIAAINNDAAAAELLLTGGAFVDACQYEGATPLCVAAKRGAISVIKVLLQHGADPNHHISGTRQGRQQQQQNQHHLIRSSAINSCVLAMQTGLFRKTPEQITHTLSILIACGAVLPRSCTVPSYLPEYLIQRARSPTSLQMNCALVIRKTLMNKGSGRSIKQLAINLLGVVPEPLIDFICFEFLNSN